MYLGPLSFVSVMYFGPLSIVWVVYLGPFSIISAITCPAEPSFPNALRLNSGKAVNAIVEYVCLPGYQFDTGLERERIQCTFYAGRGRWSRMDLMCQRK